ncbi:MAG: SCO family protein [Rhodospirillaceae bacterium]|nr:SCO family protein [Rhodospirillaceae bacterium]
MSKLRILQLSILALAAVAALVLYLPGVRPERTDVRTVEGAPAIGGAFELVDPQGRTVTDADLKGRYALVFFGFVNCPDICPLTLQTLTQALEMAGPMAEDVQPVFITVDAARDTPETMGAYIANFHPRFLALTGTPEQTKRAADAYRVYFRKAAEQEPGEYMMEHSGFVYFMDRDGDFITHFNSSATAQDIAARIRQETGFKR